MLQDFFVSESIEQCKKCNDFRLCQKRLMIYETPNNLIFHLNRFKSDNGNTNKLHFHVNIQAHVNLPYLTNDKKDHGYDLHSIIIHKVEPSQV
jgi:ubiquitin C-terminal hydrolase